MRAAHFNIQQTALIAAFGRRTLTINNNFGHKNTMWYGSSNDDGYDHRELMSGMSRS
jgi:hypothetical protein